MKQKVYKYLIFLVLLSFSCGERNKSDDASNINNIDVSRLNSASVGAFLHKAVFIDAKEKCPNGGVQFLLYLDHDNNQKPDDGNEKSYYDCYLDDAATMESNIKYSAKDTDSSISYGKDIEEFCDKNANGSFDDKNFDKIFKIDGDKEVCLSLKNKVNKSSRLSVIGPGTFDAKVLDSIEVNNSLNIRLVDVDVINWKSLVNDPRIRSIELDNVYISPAQAALFSSNPNILIGIKNFPSGARGLYLESLNNILPQLLQFESGIQLPFSTGPLENP